MVSITTTAIIRPLTPSRLPSRQPKVSTQPGDKLWQLSSSAAKCGPPWIASSRRGRAASARAHAAGTRMAFSAPSLRLARLARNYGLNPQQTLAAIGLSACACGALTRDGGTMAKPFRCGHAAATGVTSALLAQAGFSSDETALEGRYGLLEAVGPLSDEILESLAKDLGVEWDLAHSLRIKPFASCTATHSGVEAMLRLRRRGKFHGGRG